MILGILQNICLVLHLADVFVSVLYEYGILEQKAEIEKKKLYLSSGKQMVNKTNSRMNQSDASNFESTKKNRLKKKRIITSGVM